MTAEELYNKYFINNGIERYGLFETISEHFETEKALYSGSFIHIAPSFFIKSVVYVDTDKKAVKFFKDVNFVRELIESKKVYSGETEFEFLAKDYTTQLNLKENHFDLLISQYAGIISQYCKHYLKIGGILIANDSHGDAGVANLDNDYNLIGIINNESGYYRFDDTKLERFFISGRKHNLQIPDLIQKGKGLKYVNMADHYIFERIN